MPFESFIEVKCLPNIFFSIIAWNFMSKIQSSLYRLKSCFLFNLAAILSTFPFSIHAPLPVTRSTAEGRFFILELKVWQKTKKGRLCRFPIVSTVFQKLEYIFFL